MAHDRSALLAHTDELIAALVLTIAGMLIPAIVLLWVVLIIRRDQRRFYRRMEAHLGR